MKRPAFQFYPADWRKDVELQSCSIAARGFWHEILCIAHECTPYGHLSRNGNAMTVPQLARLCGVSEADGEALFQELMDAGVPGRLPDGTIYSRRMVRDEGTREDWRDRQQKSRACHGDVTDSVTPKSRRSSSSSSSSVLDARETRSKAERHAKGSLPEGIPNPEDLQWAEKHWRAKGRGDLCGTISEEVGKFRDHHTARGTRLVDWHAGWRTWVQNAVRFTKPIRANGHKYAISEVFEDTDERGWRDRLRTMENRKKRGETVVWIPKWGPAPGSPGCRVPPNLLTQSTGRSAG